MKRNRSTEVIRVPSAYFRKFRFGPHAKRWIEADDLDPPEEVDGSGEPDDPEDWDRWALDNMCDGPVFRFGNGIMVDAALLTQRFSCVSERCIPRKGRERGVHCCCADAEVSLVRAEVTRLGRMRDTLAEHLSRREPRLKELLKPRGKRVPAFYLDETKGNLCRPGERCVFSKVNKQGRIRCHLWDVARKLKVDRSEFQPYTCRVFPVSITLLERGRIVAGVLTRKNARHMGGDSPRHYPCLTDPKLPYLYDSMKNDLDWVFGAGFCKALKDVARLYDLT